MKNRSLLLCSLLTGCSQLANISNNFDHYYKIPDQDALKIALGANAVLKQCAYLGHKKYHPELSLPTILAPKVIGTNNMNKILQDPRAREYASILVMKYRQETMNQPNKQTVSCPDIERELDSLDQYYRQQDQDLAQLQKDQAEIQAAEMNFYKSQRGQEFIAEQREKEQRMALQAQQQAMQQQMIAAQQAMARQQAIQNIGNTIQQGFASLGNTMSNVSQQMSLTNQQLMMQAPRNFNWSIQPNRGTVTCYGLNRNLTQCKY